MLQPCSQEDIILNFNELETRLEYFFKEKKLLERALTHRSYTHEYNLKKDFNNESLEFLGDAVLGLIVSEWLVERFPFTSEGILSKFKSHLVGSHHLAECAKLLELGKFLRLNRGEEKTGGRAKRALLENAFEALLAAMYIDAGLEKVKLFVRKLFEPTLLKLDPLDVGSIDCKTALQDWLRSQKMSLPEYSIVSSAGPAHNPEFTVDLSIDSKVIAQGNGATIKAAHQSAACIALRYMKKSFNQ